MFYTPILIIIKKYDNFDRETKFGGSISENKVITAPDSRTFLFYTSRLW